MIRNQQAAAASIAASVRERMLQKVNKAAAMYETRWTMDALYRAAPDLHEAIEDQQSMFHEILVTGDDNEIAEHGDAMCRGWAKAIETMEKSGIANDAYHIGQFGEVTVAIGRQKHMPEFIREQYGEDVVWINPREVAAMYFQIRHVNDVKRLWPDAEIVEVRGKEEVAE